MNHLKKLGLVAAIFLIANSVSGVDVGVGQDKPNIVLVMIDDMGWKDVGFMGSSYYETPHINKLAAEGMIFSQAYANAANCAPTRACFLSGQYSPRHGVFTVGNSDRGKSKDRRLVPAKNNTTLDKKIVTIAEALKPAGYASGVFGKWHVGNTPAIQGFDVSDIRRKRAAKSTDADDPKGVAYYTGKACDFMEANRDQPFFLYLAHYSVHTHHECKADVLDYYKTKKGTVLPKHDDPVYAAMIHSLDDSVGTLMNKIQSLGLDEKTVVIFFSDNGGYGPSTDMHPLRGAKGMYYEGGIREPLAVRWKGQIKAGAKCDVPVISTDFYPTFLELAGLQKPKEKILDGVNILPLLKGGNSLERDSLFWSFPGYLEPYSGGMDEARHDPDGTVRFRTRPVSVIRKGDWKLMLFQEEWILDCHQSKTSSKLNTAVELYHLANDIGEKNDLDSAEPAKVQELLQELLAWQVSTGYSPPAGEMVSNSDCTLSWH